MAKYSEFYKGYQEALRDIANALLAGEECAAKEWVINNLREDHPIKEEQNRKATGLI